DAPTQQKMLKNKDFIICFPQFGLQLTPEDDLFESRLVINYQDVQEVKKNTPLEVKVPSAKPQSADPVEITDAVFDLRAIYPTDLNADTFSVKYANGTTKFEVELKDGLKHGRYTEYYPNGTEKMTGRFRKDEQVGTWRFYNEEGEQVHKKRF